MDLVDIVAVAVVAVSVVVLAGVIVWPFDRRDDVMQRVHGHQPSLPQ